MEDVEPLKVRSVGMQRLTFFRQWLRNPRSMASVAPSGQQLGGLMIAALPAGVRNIVELGAGTGAITEALVRSGFPPEQIFAVEMNLVLHEFLAYRFPTLHLVHADARHLAKLITSSETFACGEIDAVLSSLGLLSMPRELQYDILAAAFAVLGENGIFVQYTYGLAGPLDKQVQRQLKLSCTPIGWAWRNFPPARIFVYRKS